jgi:hypothetical protein
LFLDHVGHGVAAGTADSNDTDAGRSSSEAETSFNIDATPTRHPSTLDCGSFREQA